MKTIAEKPHALNTFQNLRKTAAVQRFGHLFYAAAIATAFSAFIYIEYFHLPHVKAIETLLALGAYLGLLTAPRRTVAWTGFFIGLAWFYWIGFSFRYYGMPWAAPLLTLFFGLVYALYFGVLAFSTRPLARALLLLGLSYVTPFHFNWMVPELPLLHTYLGFEKEQFTLILFALALIATLKIPWRFAALLLLVGAYVPPYTPPPLPPLQIKLVQMQIPQALKWKPSMQPRIIADDFAAIERAATAGADVVVLPESTFPLFLNKRPDLLMRLERLSQHITIVTGALYYEDGSNYNVTYVFHDGRSQIAKKMVLVPFGEYIPLPRWIGRWVNMFVFDGASDYLAAKQPTDFIIDDVPFRNAICYEATSEALFAGDPRYMIAISNNAWFTPSIEPTLQKLLMTYYARRHHTMIFHSANMAGTGIVQ